MNITLVLQHKLLLGIQRFMQAGRQASPQHMQPVVGRVAHNCVHPFAAQTIRPAMVRGFSTGVANTHHLADRVIPLRVLRVVDSDMPRSSAGRLVISGRMADVCAELDRLVEREAALH